MFLTELLSNRPFITAALSWLAAQVQKFFIYWAIENQVDWRRVWGSGGMPSSHTAFVVALMLSVGLTEGFGSTLFAIAAALMIIVVYDAMGVRYETGKQGQIINKILEELFAGKPISDEHLKELVGHSPSEVVVGATVGILMVLIMYL